MEQGFRGRKSDKLEAGHRVPFFMKWPKAGIQGGKDIEDLTTHVDLLPTLAGLCRMDLPENFKGDGIDLSQLLLNQMDDLPERAVFVHHRQDYRQPDPVKGTCIMKDSWRLLNGDELYEIDADPEQLNNIAEDNPEVVKELLELNEVFIANAIQRSEYRELAYNEIGSDHQEKIKLTHSTCPR